MLGSRTFATAQYSQKNWKLQNAGGTSTSVFDSPIMTRGATAGVPGGVQYNAPYFDSTDPEQRNNRQLTAQRVADARRRAAPGRTRSRAGSSTSPRPASAATRRRPPATCSRPTTSSTRTAGPELDANGALIPRFTPGVSRVQVWQPQRGASIDLTTASLFVTDHWVAARRLTFDLGLRFEAVSSNATGGVSTVDAKTLVPRLAAAFDLTGDGKTILQGTYGHYAGKYNDVQFSRNASVGNPDRYVMQYTGPAGEGRGVRRGLRSRELHDHRERHLPDRERVLRRRHSSRR